MSSPPSVTSSLDIFAEGAPEPGSKITPGFKVIATDNELLNPCNALLATTPLDKELGDSFMDWLVDLDGGQKVVSTFKNDNGQVLYMPARSK